ncbi:TadE/TadG family type IV pilus assembly protein [Thiobacter aerophilum]|uniref:TadE/TadG family type IV pilus assembly protein n=1 Tax=Thiobacter aerophilum TaxID=3121275 RepID=A0ABV0EGP9_9BURK
MRRRPLTARWARTRGASLVEFVVVAPTVLMLGLATLQAGLVYHAKSNLNYATFEAARAGAVDHARMEALFTGLRRGLVAYYGGGTTPTELAQSYARLVADLATSPVRIEILSPSKESFDDYASPALAARLKVKGRVIPNANLAFLQCPMDVPGCNHDPKTNRSGQTLQDANLLKLRVTYGIPREKQLPLVGRFYTWALSVLDADDPDTFRKALIARGRIPIVAHTVIRMQSEAIENDAMASIPGPGNDGKPKDPGPPYGGSGTLPKCTAGEAACAAQSTCDPAQGNCPDKPVCINLAPAP